VQPLRGTPEVELIGEDDEVPQLAELERIVHGPMLTASSPRCQARLQEGAGRATTTAARPRSC
jgi:collagenase-like PrtC family protease